MQQLQPNQYPYQAAQILFLTHQLCKFHQHITNLCSSREIFAGLLLFFFPVKETVVANNEKTVDEEMEIDQEFKSPDQISNELVTLSLLPESQWRNLVNLDVIKVRNCIKIEKRLRDIEQYPLLKIGG